jgi:hypothetical protein
MIQKQNHLSKTLIHYNGRDKKIKSFCKINQRFRGEPKLSKRKKEDIYQKIPKE